MRERFNPTVRCYHMAHEPNKQCKSAAVFRYEAMGGGYCYLCTVHGERYRSISEHIIDGLGAVAQKIHDERAALTAASEGASA